MKKTMKPILILILGGTVLSIGGITLWSFKDHILIDPVHTLSLDDSQSHRLASETDTHSNEGGAMDTSRDPVLGTPKIDTPPSEEVKLLIQDPLMKKKWDLEHIKASHAWTMSTGNKDIIVAIIGTGIDIHHEDLKDNIWKNKSEIPGNGIDDDQNTYIDDMHGWNFAHISENGHPGSPVVTDEHGHGTHVAGITGAVGGNGIGLSGVAPNVQLMALKYYDHNNPQNLIDNEVEAIWYALLNGAHIINFSSGGFEANKKEEMAIRCADKLGVLFVVASGNERSNVDRVGYYPASYPLSNILALTAYNKQSVPLPSSNWGEKTKAGPGYSMLSTLPDNRYGRMTGTSQATPLASGAAVLIMDHYKLHEQFSFYKDYEHLGKRTYICSLCYDEIFYNHPRTNLHYVKNDHRDSNSQDKELNVNLDETRALASSNANIVQYCKSQDKKKNIEVLPSRENDNWINPAYFVISQLKMTGAKISSLDGKSDQARNMNIFHALISRGMKVNFTDQIVQAGGRVYHQDTGSDKVPGHLEDNLNPNQDPLIEDMDEIEQINNALRNSDKQN